MVDEQEPAKRVVKRVVRKTVVRPTAAAKPAQLPRRVRYGRPAAPTAPTATPTTDKVATARLGTIRSRPATAPKAPRRRVDLPAKVNASRQRAASAWRVVTARRRTLAGWRLPRVNPYLAAAVTGAVVGLVAVALGILALTIFDAVRGVSSGGGLWGGLTFAAIAVIAGFAGEALLRGFGSTSGRLTSFFAVVLIIIAMLGLFLDLVDTGAALALLPLLGIAAFALSHWLIDLAENTPPEID